MALIDVKVPQLSESVAEATLLTWKKKPGEAVAMDEILIEIETDKVVLELPAPESGVLAKIAKGDGGTVTSNEVNMIMLPQSTCPWRLSHWQKNIMISPIANAGTTFQIPL